MKCLTRLLGLTAVAGMIVTVAGCNETTRKDVTAAQNKVVKEERKLDDIRREEARAIEEKKQAAPRTVNKPVIADDPVERERIRASERLTEQNERVAEAKADAREKENKLATEQARDKFLIDCKAQIDLANRAIEKLETKKNAADDGGKEALDRDIASIKAQRDRLQKEMNSIRTSEVSRWSEHQAAAQQAMVDLKNECLKAE